MTGAIGLYFFRISMKEYCTSALVNGLPLWKVTPSWSLKVMVLPSGATSHAVARFGCGFWSQS